jgi:hypothetical protein
MTVFLVICLLLILPLIGGASYLGYQVFSILLLTLIVLIIVSFFEFLYIRRRLKIGTFRVVSEIPRDEIVHFILPVAHDLLTTPMGSVQKNGRLFHRFNCPPCSLGRRAAPRPRNQLRGGIP